MIYSPRKQRFGLVVLLIGLNLLVLLPVLAQAELPLLTAEVDTSSYPTISINLATNKTDGVPITSLANLTINESGTDITNFITTTIPTGANVIFVIDANGDILLEDNTPGSSRLNKVQESIGRFANQFMDPNGVLDRASILVPSSTGGRFHIADTADPAAVIAAIDGYSPDPFGTTPLNTMMESVLEQTAQDSSSGRFQAVVLFTDGATLNTQLDYATLLGQAEFSDTHIYSAILGSRADNNEIANVNRLSEPTNGAYVHMPTPDLADTLYQSIQFNSAIYQVTYETALTNPGTYTMALGLDEATVEFPFELVVPSLSVEITAGNDQPIVRLAEAFNTPLAALEPTEHALSISVLQPGETSRSLTAASLLVNGEEVQTIVDPVLESRFFLTFDWDISELDVGDYQLEVLIVDEFGIESQSEAVSFTIEVERPAASLPTPTIEPTVAPTAVPTIVPEVEEEPPEQGISTGLIGGIVVVLLIVVIGGVFMLRRRQKSGQDEGELDLSYLSPSQTIGKGEVTFGEEGLVDTDGGFIDPETAVGDPVFGEMATEEAPFMDFDVGVDDVGVDDVALDPDVERSIPAILEPEIEISPDIWTPEMTPPDSAPPAVISARERNAWMGAYLEIVENAPAELLADDLAIIGNNITIGRDPNVAQIVIRDQSVSRLHARIIKQRDTYLLYDEGSASGTFLNFKRIGLAPQPLHDGVDIHIGRVRFRFRMP